MIKVEHANKTFSGKYGTVHALQDVSIHVEKGDIYGIIGFSGAGKSTLIRLVNGLETPDTGNVIVQGENLGNLKKTQLRKLRRKIGMVFQQFNLLESKTVYHNIALPLILEKAPKEEIDKKVKEVLRFVELEDKKDVLWADVPDLVKIQVHMEQAETTASTFVVPVLARYHHSSTRIWEIASVPFYFTSDRLTEEGKEYQLSPETEALSIELRNDQDGNRWSDTPIHYIYQVKKDGEEQEEKGGEGILYPQQGAGSSERIVIQDMTPGVYDIEVQSQSPFEKTLKGTFIIPEKENDIFCVKEDRQGSFCVQLTVSVKDYEGNIKIFWPEGLIPDSTQAVFEDVKTRTEDLYEAGELTLWMEPYTSRTYRFFKTDTETDYTWDTQLRAEAAD